MIFSFYFSNDPATTEIYTLSLHDALPISHARGAGGSVTARRRSVCPAGPGYHADSVGRIAGSEGPVDRKSTRLNSSHTVISYAVFCLKKKKKKKRQLYNQTTKQGDTLRLT